jgi:hypothetical protein
LIASKVAVDLLRFQRFYGAPDDELIDKYEKEITELLRHDVVKEVVYGFKRNGRWTEAAIRYRALQGGGLNANDDPGKIRPNLDVANAHFTSFLTYNAQWGTLSQSEKDSIRAACPFQRTTANTPDLECGFWINDHTYTAANRGLARSSVRR